MSAKKTAARRWLVDRRRFDLTLKIDASMAAGALIAVTITAASAVLYADLRFPAIRAERPLRPISRRSAASRLRPVNSR